MMLPRPVRVLVYLAGRPWTVWVVAIGAVIANRAGGAGGFDAVALAIGPVLLWLGFSWVCRMLTRHTGNPFERSILPANKTLPKPQLAVIVAPDEPSTTCPTPHEMIAELPDHLLRLVRAEEG